MVTVPMPKHDGECSFCRCEATFSDPENCKTAEQAVLCSWLDKNQREQLEGEISARIVDAELAALPKAPAVAGIEITAEMVEAALGNNPRGSMFIHPDDMRAALTRAFALVTPGDIERALVDHISDLRCALAKANAWLIGSSVHREPEVMIHLEECSALFQDDTAIHTPLGLSPPLCDDAGGRP